MSTPTKQFTNNEILKATSDAYSYDRYGRKAWMAAIKLMREHGLEPLEIEVVLRSKHMRWAMDNAGNKNKPRAFAEYIVYVRERYKQTLKQLVADLTADGVEYCMLK